MPNACGHPALSRGRLEYLALLRCLAIGGVVIMHSASPLLGEEDLWRMLPGLLYSSLCLFCVPTLLMISGALMLRGDRVIDLKSFYRKRFLKILVPLLAWSAIYYLSLCIQLGDWPNLGTFIKRFVTGLWAGPLWFLYMIAGVYLMVPFMRAAFAGQEALRRGLAFCGIVFGLHALNFAARLIWEQELNRFLSSAVFPYYFAYFVLGHVLNETSIRIPGGRPLLAALFLAGAAATAGGEYLAFGANTMLPNTFFCYQQPIVVAMSVSVFLFFKGWSPATGQRATTLLHEVSGLSYGVFLAHLLVMMFLTGQMTLFVTYGNGLDWNTLGPWVGPLLSGVATFTFSALLTAALKRLPVLNRIVP